MTGIILSLVSLAYVLSSNSFKKSNSPYLKLLLIKWKVGTLFVAYLTLILFGKFAGDPTWEFYSSTVMSILTFMTAPWVVAVLIRSIMRKRASTDLFLAGVFWMASVSWSYELIVYLRTGFPASAALENFYVSSCIYFLAGLFWNISLKDHKLSFEFSDENWPNIKPNHSLKIIFYGIPIMVLYLWVLVRLLYAN